MVVTPVIRLEGLSEKRDTEVLIRERIELDFAPGREQREIKSGANGAGVERTHDATVTNEVVAILRFHLPTVLSWQR